MVEVIVTRHVYNCSDALKRLSLERLIDALRGKLELADMRMRGSRVDATLVYHPDEFTKKRFKVRLESRREANRLIVRGKGDAELELIAECSDDRLVMVLTLHGKIERIIDENLVRKNVEKLIDSIITQPSVSPAGLPAVAGGGVETVVSEDSALHECIVRLISAGLRFDEGLSTSIPVHLHQHANRGSVVEEARSSTSMLDTSKYVNGYSIRYFIDGDVIEIIRVGDKFGICAYRPSGTLCGREALVWAVYLLCEKGGTVDYMVIRLP